MSKAPTDDKDNKDDAKEVKGVPPTLEEVNDATQAKLENDDEQDTSGDDSDSKDDSEDEDTSGDADDKATGDSDASDEASGEGDSDESSDDISDEEDEPDDKPTKTSKIPQVSVKGFDGKTYKFDSLDDVPDDFEPASYKENNRMVRDLIKREGLVEKAEADEAKATEDKATKDRTDALQKSWDKDVKDLKLDEDATNEVYEYMEKQLKEGVVIDNFKVARKAMLQDQAESKVEQDRKDLADKKKARGARVQAGGTQGGTKPVVKKGVPFGASLNDVHNHVLSEMD